MSKQQMSVADLGDPVVLDSKQSILEAEAAVYTGKRVRRHFLSEFTNDIDLILDTVAQKESLVYGVGNVDASGKTVLEALSTREGARGHYENIRSFMDIQEWRPFTELRRDWYVFYDGVVTQKLAQTAEVVHDESIVLFPIGPETGIQGELAWSRHAGRRYGEPRSGDDPDPTPMSKVANLDLHDRLVASWAAGNAEAAAACLATDVGTSLRDYVTGSPYKAIYGRDAARSYYQQLFDLFAVRNIDLLNIVTGNWFFFAEHRWDTVCRQGEHSGEPARFCTAIMFPIMSDGAITAQIGYGTDVVYG